jgi:hypothetical protein
MKDKAGRYWLTMGQSSNGKLLLDFEDRVAEQKAIPFWE